MTQITEPGIYYDLTAKDYHSQSEWLSWSRMKHLLPPSTPAHFKAAEKRPEERARHFDLGKVVHTLALGDGDEFQVVQALNRQKEPYDATSYDTVSAQVDRDRIYSEGKVPILRHELEQAHLMAAALREHPVSGALLSQPGRPEVSLFWIDPGTGVRCRARVDWLPDSVEGRRLVVPDVKTATTAAPLDFAKAAASYGYYGQHVHYCDGIKALGIDKDPAFLFAVVEKTDPHLVMVGQFADRDDLRLARTAVDHCRRLYAECAAADQWPGYSPGVTNLALPGWFTYSMEEALA